MAAETTVPLTSEVDLRTEIESLKRELLPVLLLAIAGLSWAWFGYVLANPNVVRLYVGPTVMMLLGVGLAWLLRSTHFALGCRVLVGSLVIAEGLVVASGSLPCDVGYGILVVIVANALLGAGQAFATATVLCGAVSLASWMGLGQGSPVWHFCHTLALYLLAWGATSLSARPLRSMIGSAVIGWSRARDALVETRARRAEIYRVARALEEATYRIERMNNELVLARREAESARALKARFAATVSHELRGPLNLILGFSELMALSPERYGDLTSDYHTDMDTIYRNSQHLVALVDDVLDLSQMEVDHLPLVKDRIDLAEDVVRKAVNTVRPLAEHKGLFVHEKLQEDLPCVLADAVRLRQALLNLLTNATRFTERGGITVSTRSMPGSLLVSVADTGPGIRADDMHKLFQEFSQLHETETRESRGTGLGLAISKHLIEAHGGRLWAESQLGTGTTFRFSVPLPSTEVGDVAFVKTAPAAIGSHWHHNCLIVHDDPAVIRLLARHIEGYRVVGLPDEREVCALTKELHPRAILTTPERRQTILEQLSETHFDVPIVTADLPRGIEETWARDVVGYLIKPVSPEGVRALMTKVERDGETIVLLVDDEPDAVRLLERLINSLHRPYRVVKAYGGAQALKLMRETRPDVVLLDLMMPGLDGEQVLEQMRADERLSGLPVIVVSAKDWIGTKTTMGTSVDVRFRGPIGVSRGLKCMKALVDAVTPHYLQEQGPTERSGAGLVGQLASSALPERPRPRPAEVG